MDVQEDEESRMYCNISHADMRQGKTRLVMTSRVKGRIAQFCAKHGVSSKSLPDGATCVALMKHIGFFTADTSVLRNVTTKVLTWIQSNISQAKMSGMLKEESTTTEGSKKKYWKIQYAVIATKWIDDDYNPFQNGFGQARDVQFAPPVLRQSRSLEAAVNAAVEAAVDVTVDTAVDVARETCTANAVVRRKSQPEEDDIVMDELYDLDETTATETSLSTPSAPPTAATPPWSPGETPFHRAVAHMMVIANDSTMDQVQMYLNSEQGIKDAIARLFQGDHRTQVEPGSEEFIQTREHANALAIENRGMRQRIRNLEHEISILADITNQSEYIALESRLRNLEKELLLVQKDATFEKEKLAEELAAAQDALASRPTDLAKSIEYLALQQRCQSLEEELTILRSSSTSDKDKPIAQQASAQHALATRDLTKTVKQSTVQRQLEISEKALELAREDSKRQQSTIQDLQNQLAALKFASSVAESQDVEDGEARQLMSPIPDQTAETEAQAEKQCSLSDEALQEERGVSDTVPGSLQAAEDHLWIPTVSVDEELCLPLMEISFRDHTQNNQQGFGPKAAASKHSTGENDNNQQVHCADHGVLFRKAAVDLDECDKINSAVDGHFPIPTPDDSAAPPGTITFVAASAATDHAEEDDSPATFDLSLHSPSSHSSRATDSTNDDSSAVCPLAIRSSRIQRPELPSWM